MSNKLFGQKAAETSLVRAIWLKTAKSSRDKSGASYVVKSSRDKSVESCFQKKLQTSPRFTFRAEVGLGALQDLTGPHKPPPKALRGATGNSGGVGRTCSALSKLALIE